MKLGITPERDQQIGGLLMWVPMCFIYLAPSSLKSRAGSRTVTIRQQTLTTLMDSKILSNRMKAGNRSARASSSTELFSRRTGHGNHLLLLGIHHFMGHPRGRDRSFHASLAGWITKFAVNEITANIPLKRPVTPEEITRRRFFEKVCLGLGGLCAAILGVPLVGFVIAPLFRKTPANGSRSVKSTISKLARRSTSRSPTRHRFPGRLLQKARCGCAA